MSLWGIAMLLLAGTEPASAEPAGEIRILLAQLTVRERLIVRVPARPGPPPVVKWKEKKAPKCMAMESDMIQRGGQRIRAEFENDCPALGYYSGFYISPTEDGQICAGRDAVRTRAGGECIIKRFRKLVPDK